MIGQKFAQFVRMEVRAAVYAAAKTRPETLFEQAFYDIRQKVKDLKSGWEQQAATTLENQLIRDLQERGVKIEEAKLSLGQYRGSRFVTSFKLKVMVGNPEQAERLVSYLRWKYSPKWKVKSVSDDGIAELNVR